MGDLFHGWRRKAGCVALAMACVFAAGWVRSMTVSDVVLLPNRNILWGGSYDGYLWLRWTLETDASSREDWYFQWKSDDLNDPYIIYEKDPYGRPNPTPRFLSNPGFFKIRYQSIVPPLMLLSAYLLLSKPRVAKPTKTVESTKAERS